ncbi:MULTISPECIES: ABC transporter permease [Caproicibacterium]|uniref:ABC transporter permease n=1 Tax=Caproicibacterium argilliputei TaxID=3030016 RepID=A0AA97D9K3_9FIRM|nr:ABC transporter permease [Caproicibacterium argilliputei]WOC31957.1 ABC transporter permease [Caproicibacterium argilliputei]
MDIFIGLVQVILREGFLYGIMAVGVYITYKVLDFPDLTVDGSFPLGMCTAAALITVGVDPWLACLASFAAGAAAGAATGLLHVKLHITDLLSGILVMTALYSVNMVITEKKAVMAIFNMPTIFNSGLGGVLHTALGAWGWVLMAFLVCIVVKLVVDAYLKTRSGLLLRASGSNPQFVVSQGKNPGNMKILGLILGNGLTALSGCVLAQQKESADIASGTGMVVMSLAAVIIGAALFGRIKWMKPTLTAIFGMILYRACLAAAMQLGLDTNYLKMLMSILFIIALVASRFTPGRRKHDAAIDRTRI